MHGLSATSPSDQRHRYFDDDMSEYSSWPAPMSASYLEVRSLSLGPETSYPY